MDFIVNTRINCHLSQRGLARRAGVSFRALQLVESGRHDPRISTLAKIARGLGYPPRLIENQLNSLFRLPVDSIAMVSERILEEGDESWKLHLFNFVDAFRRDKKREYIESPPAPATPTRVRALLAATVETLCAELGMPPPEWCEGMVALREPWFVAEMEGLKASALVESPVHFRKRNIFVLKNILDRV